MVRRTAHAMALAAAIFVPFRNNILKRIADLDWVPPVSYGINLTMLVVADTLLTMLAPSKIQPLLRSQRAVSCLIRSLSLWCGSSNVPPRTVSPIDHGRMSSHSVVPDHNSLPCLLDTALDILRERHMIIQELEQVVTFLLLEPNNISGELRVDIQTLLTRCGTRSN